METTKHEPGLFTMNMVHSEEELLHGLKHLMGDVGSDCDEGDEPQQEFLRGHETMILYRNVRKKYSTEPGIKEGLHCIETFRTPEQGLEAAYRAALCRNGPVREASALYVAINPRNVSEAHKLTQANYSHWLEAKAGVTREQPKGKNREDYLGTLDRALRCNILRCQARKRLDMIDVDDTDPTTWLRRIREAIGDEHIDMITQTKNGYHVLYQGKKMNPQEHRRLQNVLSENPGKGPMEKVTRGKGATVACALPGGSQSFHKTRIIYCACQRKQRETEEETV
eukprot:CAMPEP_0117004500 /NCGR_PEP_ID=MMETSP0472-20121206/5443_1 /TAXON_ID=693140 ORGANISM="Tiarina fusus, Strain LIS" /NCGR_SAMPLE_ID=MMETSP0472 /ASSEMBLY_ACC=CAM_ASM_000603 /LENGTH=281 /DNA_ID=CAMNT_0004705457 /DNA_START=52 /DNA_END=897 /DNA_ORIENTATION=+